MAKCECVRAKWMGRKWYRNFRLNSFNRMWKEKVLMIPSNGHRNWIWLDIELNMYKWTNEWMMEIETIAIDYLVNRFSVCSTRKYLTHVLQIEDLDTQRKRKRHTEREREHGFPFPILNFNFCRILCLWCVHNIHTMSVWNCYFRTVNWLDAIQMWNKFSNMVMHRSKWRWKVTRMRTKEANKLHLKCIQNINACKNPVKNGKRKIK